MLIQAISIIKGRESQGKMRENPKAPEETIEPSGVFRKWLYIMGVKSILDFYYVGAAFPGRFCPAPWARPRASRAGRRPPTADRSFNLSF
jgi:hypothetical protein